jgi:hypothetical protein
MEKSSKPKRTSHSAAVATRRRSHSVMDRIVTPALRVNQQVNLKSNSWNRELK